MSDVKNLYGEILSLLLDHDQVKIKPEWSNHVKDIKNDFENLFGLVISTPRRNYWSINKQSNTQISGIKFFKEKETYQLFYLACAFLNTTLELYFTHETLQQKVKEYAMTNLPDLYESQTPFDEYLIKHMRPIVKALKYLNIIEDYDDPSLETDDDIYYRTNKPSDILISNDKSLVFRGKKDNEFKEAMNYLLTNTYVYKHDVPDIYNTLQLKMDDVLNSLHYLSYDYNSHSNYHLIEKNDYMMIVRQSKNYTSFPSNTNIDKILSQILIELELNSSYSFDDLHERIENNTLYQKLKIKDSIKKLTNDLIHIGLTYGFLNKTNNIYQPTILINILNENKEESSNDNK